MWLILKTNNADVVNYIVIGKSDQLIAVFVYFFLKQICLEFHEQNYFSASYCVELWEARHRPATEVTLVNPGCSSWGTAGGIPEAANAFSELLQTAEEGRRGG